MAARKIGGDRYTRLDNQNENRAQDHDRESSPLLEHIASAENDLTDPQILTNSRSIVRRRRSEPRPSPVSIMSLVGLKNLFFSRTLTPIPARIKSNQSTLSAPTSSPYIGLFGYSSDSREPLLQSTAMSSQLLTPPTPDDSRPNHFEIDDVESQSTDSKTLKANQAKGFRIDARVISDATIGLSDGLTVPFALTAGLSALGNTKVVIYGGFAELIAGAISMGLGGYLGAKSEAASYQAQREKTETLIATNPQTVIQDITEVFQPYGVPKETIEDLTKHLADSPRLVDFVMHFQHCEEEPASNRAFVSALTIALGYFLGGLLPLIPYFCVGSSQVYEGLYISIGVMVIALFAFGYGKTGVVIGWSGGKNIRACCFGGVQMVVVGGAAAAAAMGLVKLFNHDEGGVEMSK